MIHLKGDPKFPCRNYDAGEYHQCLEEEYSRQFVSILNCSLPWISEKRDVWCKDNLNISDQIIGQHYNLIDQVSYGKADIGTCLSPCKITSFEVEDIGFYSVKNYRGMVIAFSNEVEVLTSELQISAKTFLTRVGGVIGVGKEFFWIILSCFSFIKLFLTVLRAYKTDSENPV